jgi:V8-like Glu-specific endopeptidase
MRSRMPLTIASALALILIAIVAAPAAGAPGGNSAAARAEHDRVVAFWTPERMASAIPRDLAPVDRPDPVAKGGVPGKPGGGGGGGGGGGDSTAVTGAHWTKGGDVTDQTGKVYFVISPWAYVCSGSVVNDSRSGVSLVLTAGHCAYDFKKGFVTNWLYIPNFDADPVGGYPPACNNTQYGCWTAQALVVHNGFASQTGFTSQATRYDWAFAVVGAGGKSSQQLDNLGSYPIQYEGGINAGDRVTSFGYPAASPYDGTKLIWCAGNAFSDSLNGGNTWGLKCNATGGTSGGPWIDGISEDTGDGGTLSSVNSYRYNGGDSIYGPKFNSNTQATYNAANGATSNTIVP